METGIDQHGRLLAHRVRIVADTGAYATLGAPVLNFATEHAMGTLPYSECGCRRCIGIYEQWSLR